MAKKKQFDPALAKDVLDDTLRHQVYLERLKAGLVQEMLVATAQAEAKTVEILRQLEDDNLNALTRRELDRLLKDIQNATGDIYDGGLDKLFDSLDDVALYTVKREADAISRWAKKISTTATKPLIKPVGTKVMGYVLDQPVRATGQLLEGFVNGLKPSALKKVEGAIRNGWAEGKTIGQVAREIRGTKAKSYRDGIGIKTRREAEAVVRTATQHVANTARAALWNENTSVVKGYIWISTLDNKTTIPCQTLDRTRFKLGEGPMPPLHVGCRSTTIADLGPAFDFLDKGATRSTAAGYVNANQSFYEFLRTQDKEFQNDALGVARAKLFRDGGLSNADFAKLNIGKNFEPLTLKEMQARDSAAFKRAGLALAN